MRAQSALLDARHEDADDAVYDRVTVEERTTFPVQRQVRVGASRWSRGYFKRLFDFAVAAAALPLAVPLIAGVALVSAVRFGGNPFFVQERVGRNNKTFRVTKIRSLPKSFPRVGRHQFDHDSVCRWGKFLRDTHIDELPQLFNVLNGSMSMVGPRPMISEVLDELPREERRARSLVRPGLTGVWQVSTAGGRPLQECPELDVASQGDTVEGARENLREALELFFECASAQEIHDRLGSEVFVTQVEVTIG